MELRQTETGIYLCHGKNRHEKSGRIFDPRIWKRYFGTSYGTVKPSGIFRINVLKNSNMKNFALFTPKNKNAKREIGFLPIFRTQERTTVSSEK